MDFMRKYLFSLLLLCGLSTGAWSAADLCTSAVISQTDASNGSGTMPSWSGSAAPSTLDDAGRALQGAIARDWNWRNLTVTAGGTADAKTLTYSVAPLAYCSGQQFAFIANTTNTGSATLNVNGLGAKTIKKDVSGTMTALSASDMPSGTRVIVMYDGTDMIWVNWQGATPVVSGSITASGYTQSTAKLLGRTTASTGAIEEITVSSPLSFSAGALGVGNIPVTNLNSGTSASATTFWRGDATWATPSAVSVIVKTADQSASNTTLANDTHLTFSMLANTNYKINVKYYIDVTTTGGLKVGISGPATPTSVTFMDSAIPEDPSKLSQPYTSYSTSATASDGITSTGATGVVVNIEIIWKNASNAGTFVMQIANASGSGSTFRAGSSLTYVTF